MSFVSYLRSGGYRPPNDELLEIEEDGTFRLRRVVAGKRVGEFAGSIPAATMKTLARHLHDPGLAAAEVREPPMPPIVVEVVTAPGFSVEAGFEAPIRNKPLAALIRTLRKLTEELTSQPLGALELAIQTDKSRVMLERVGDATVEASIGKLTYDLFGKEQELLASGGLQVPFAEAGNRELPPGWTAEAPLPADLVFTPERTLQVRFTFRMKYSDGLWRDAQLSAVAGKGWS